MSVLKHFTILYLEIGLNISLTIWYVCHVLTSLIKPDNSNVLLIRREIPQILPLYTSNGLHLNFRNVVNIDFNTVNL